MHRLYTILMAIIMTGPHVSLGAAPPGPTTSEPVGSIRVAEDGQHFVDDQDKLFRVWGVNYDHDDDGQLLEDYWQTDWPRVVEDFKEIKALGANVVRVHLQLGKFMDAPDRLNPTALGKLAELLRLAEQLKLYLDITGLGCYHKADVPSWYDALEEEERWKVQANFWRSVAEVGRDSSAVFCYDLMNEPILPGANKPEKEWLTGELAGKYFVQRVTLDLRGRTREQVAEAWVQQLTSAIRAIDNQHLITVGVIPWSHVFPGAKPIFYAPGPAQYLDFVSVHIYPKKGEVAKALAALDVYRLGKPLLIEEFFPLECSIEEAEEFIAQSETAGIVSFYWGKSAREYQADGDLKGALVAKWLATFEKLAK